MVETSTILHQPPQLLEHRMAISHVVLLAALMQVQAPESPAQRNTSMEWWRDARFGMFIHWGAYAVPAGTYHGERIRGIGEWIMSRAHIPILDYEKYVHRFNPTRFDADEWVRIAQEAGMKYIIITSKHHDGFAIFDSKVSSYDIMDATPYQRDAVKALAEAAHRASFKFGVYYSIMDWHHPELEAGPMRRLGKRLDGVSLVRRGVHDIVARDLRVENGEPVVVLGGDDEVLHPRVPGHAHPFVRVEPDGVEAVDILLVLRDGDVRPAHDPLADARDALSLVRAGWHCVGPPVDEHPEPRLAPPRHARVALGGGFGRGGLH